MILWKRVKQIMYRYWTAVQHPSFSPDLAPPDYYMTRNTKKMRERKEIISFVQMYNS